MIAIFARYISRKVKVLQMLDKSQNGEEAELALSFRKKFQVRRSYPMIKVLREKKTRTGEKMK